MSAGAPSRTPLGSLSAPPDPLAGFKGPTSKGKEGREGRGVEGPTNKGREMKGGRGGKKGGSPRLLRFHPDLGVPDQGEIYMENSVSTARPAHSAVMSRPGLYLVEGKAARE